MAEMNSHGKLFAIHLSGTVAQSIRRVQRQAIRQGRGDRVVAALREIHEQLLHNPRNLGEPFYRLAALRLEVRTCVIRPVTMDFAVHLDQPIVFIKGVKLLTDFMPST